MRRVMNGYWPFCACMGYRHEHRTGEGRILVRKEPVASIIQEGLEGYASGRFQTQAEVKRFFESPRTSRRTDARWFATSSSNDVLTKPLYAGYIEAPDWDIPLRKARREGLIDFAAFERIQDRLKGRAKAPARADINTDFPLRGTIACAHCGKPLTACWSTSKTGKKHPYYMCFAKGCGEYRKSIKRDEIEGAFTALLDSLVPSPRLFALARAMFRDAWNQRAAQAVEIARGYEREVVKIEKQIGLLVDRIVDSSSDTIIAAYEKRIGSLERTKLALEEKRAKSGERQGTFEELFERAFDFLANPSKLWHLGRFEYRRLVLRLSFAEQLAYCRNEGFRTPKTTMPFRMLSDLQGGGNMMAEREGV